MYRKRQRGGNFKGKKYQRSKQDGGNIIGKIKNSKITKTLRKHMQSVGQQLGQRNTIPSAKYVMYQR